MVLAAGTWRTAWLASAGCALAFTVAAWALRPGPRPSRPAADQRRAGAAGRPSRPPRAHRWFAVLLASYSLEGVGYIIAGTFLVAAINENSPAWAGSGAWVLAGLAAIPAAAAWAQLSRRWTRSTLLCAALLIQAAGIALPALVGGVAPALLSAVLFGATFLGVVSMALALGDPAAVPARGGAADHRLRPRPDPRPARGDAAAAPRLPAWRC